MAYYYTKTKRKPNSIEFQQAQFRVPEELDRCTLVDWKESPYYKLALDYIEAFPNNDPKGLYIYGETSGTGKSSLCVSICRELIRLGKTHFGCYWFPAETLFEDLREIHNSGIPLRQAPIFRKMIQSDLIIMDDLGIEKLTQFSAGRYLAIVNPLWSEGKNVLITSKFGRGQLLKRAEPGVDTFLLDSIANRLAAMTTLIKYENRDFRNS